MRSRFLSPTTVSYVVGVISKLVAKELRVKCMQPLSVPVLSRRRPSPGGRLQPDANMGTSPYVKTRDTERSQSAETTRYIKTRENKCTFRSVLTRQSTEYPPERTRGNAETFLYMPFVVFGSSLKWPTDNFRHTANQNWIQRD